MRLHGAERFVVIHNALRMIDGS